MSRPKKFRVSGFKFRVDRYRWALVLPPLTRNFSDFFAGLLQNVQGQVDLPLADVEGREEADDLVPASQEKKAEPNPNCEVISMSL
jgi:hypothetical protein